MRLKPDYNLESIFDIDLKELKNNGIKIILSDLDSTVMPSKSAKFPEKVTKWINEVKKDFKFAVISNNKSVDYINKVQSQCDFDVIGNANKPSAKVIKQYLNDNGYKMNEAVMVGDRPLTDILAGKRAGVKTILVDSITKDTEKKIVRFVRILERLTVKK